LGIPRRKDDCLVRRVRLHKNGDAVFVQVAFGTTKLKMPKRVGKDLIIVNMTDMVKMGLSKATRFDLDRVTELPWCEEWFPVPVRRFSPIIGRLDERYIEELLTLARMRKSN